ncbi:MAG: SPASM domain-containing protein, partial [Coriobacteriales bacterium]|nr:SPASM domain-containing protein [Coriobacteriales bacterium]
CFGGEPLMGPEIIESLSGRLMALCEVRGVAYSACIISNGYLLTQDIVDMLVRVKVDNFQVTLDGLGAMHDATRHLAGGGPTFERIVSNLRELRIPFEVSVRHNVYADNLEEMDSLHAFVDKLAEESGNKFLYWPAIVVESEAAEGRDDQVGLLCGSDASELGTIVEARRFQRGRGHFCSAQTLWAIGVDDKGRLHKCWESVDKPRYSFGTAHDWDPADPLNTASEPDNLTKYLNTASPVADKECRECVWLPLCVGGCPHRRLVYERQCIAFKDDPESYVLALHARIGEQ